MTFTYNEDIATSPLDWVRFLVGDTDLDDDAHQLLSDEEINGLIGSETDMDELYGVAAFAAEAIAAKFRKYPPTRIGGLSNIDLRRVVESYERLAVNLRTRASMSSSSGGSGGIKICAGGTEKSKAFHISNPEPVTSWETTIEAADVSGDETEADQ